MESTEEKKPAKMQLNIGRVDTLLADAIATAARAGGLSAPAWARSVIVAELRRMGHLAG